jgi:hypothetical protein
VGVLYRDADYRPPCRGCTIALGQPLQNHIQVANHNGTFYHLNPDLVFDVNQIVLCCVCAENPIAKDQKSIAAGNDYG